MNDRSTWRLGGWLMLLHLGWLGAACAQDPTPTPAPEAPAIVLKPGWQTLTFPELPIPDSTPSWLDYSSKPEDKVFHLYVPKDYDPAKTYGYLGWLDAGEGGEPPRQFQDLYDQYGLIVIGVEKAGNNEHFRLRVALAISALLEISKFANIDPNRHFLFGISGGARASFIAGFCHPELINGIIGWCGAEFYHDFPQGKKPGMVWQAFPRENPKVIPTPGKVASAKKNIRFAILTGETGFTLDSDTDNYNVMKSEHFQILFVVEKGLGHAVGSPETMKQGLDFILGADNPDNPPASP